MPVNYDFPFNVPSLLVPVLPTQELQQRYFPVPRFNKAHQPSWPSRKPETLEEALRRAERMAAHSDLPTNYDFPFGIPSLLIDTFSYQPLVDPVVASPQQPPRPSPQLTEPHLPPRSSPKSPVDLGVNPPPIRSSKVKAKRPGKAEAHGKRSKDAGDVLAALDTAVSHLSTSNTPVKADLDFFGDDLVSTLEPQKPTSLDSHRSNSRLKPIHVLASNITSTYMAHSLSLAKQLPPVSLLMPGHVRQTWDQEGQMIKLMRGGTLRSSGDLVVETVSRFPADDELGHIDQLVVTSHAGRILKELGPLVPRIDHRTVICLVQDALGMPEFLNERLFTDPKTRPLYVLGHMTFLPRHIRLPRGASWYTFAIGEALDPGSLYLTATVGDAHKYDLCQKHPPAQVLEPHDHFLYAMTTDKKLNVESVPMGRFLQVKLPDMVFLAAVDSLVALLDCEYGELCRLESGLNLLEQLLSEMTNVIVNLPELKSKPAFLKYVADGKLRGDILGKMRSLGPSRDSHLRAFVRHGDDIDVDHTVGWFVRRGKELGLDLPVTWSVMESVKAKTKLARKRNDAMISFQKS